MQIGTLLRCLNAYSILTGKDYISIQIFTDGSGNILPNSEDGPIAEFGNIEEDGHEVLASLLSEEIIKNEQKEK